MAIPSKDDFNSLAMSPTESVPDLNSGEDNMNSTASPSASREDLRQIWEWNASLPGQIQGCIHDQITNHAERQPDALAVCAWDGNFTYSELNTVASKVARKFIIQRHGITPQSSIPLLFSKSKWTPVAMLAVLKAGCSAIALDATQPDTRLRSIVEQARPGLIISSETHRDRAASLAGVPVLQLDEAVFGDGTEEDMPELPVVSPEDIAYISFTSGTTGQPKGACISHANVRSASHYQGAKLGFNSSTRVLDFAPYSFDVAWGNFLHTLCAGGTLCIPSEEEMLTDLSSAVTTFKATLINVTPTVLRTIHPISECLETVLLSGEMPYRENITKWAGKVRLVNTYGPTECTFKCAFSDISLSLEGRPDMGRGVGFATWLVDPIDNDRLVPIGSEGELWLEGPQVGQGYLNDLEKTAEAFVNDPPWLVACGRQGRLYKTGDLVKYLPDGRLMFVGRADSSQLKIRGQRVEIGDVEHHVRACLEDELPIIVDVVVPKDAETNSLALFVVTKNQDSEKIKALMDGLGDKLREVLPAFMIPSVYLPIDKIPVASTGKVDRRSLREMGSAMSWEKIVQLQSAIMTATEYHEPTTGTETRLRHIWAGVLGLDPTRISTADNFLRLGGDSIGAMRVVAAAREYDISLSVADILTNPVLSGLGLVADSKAPGDESFDTLPFSLLTVERDVDIVRKEAAKICGINSDEVEDIFPVTSLQEGMLADGAEYVSRTVFELPPLRDINLEWLEVAWESTAKQASITRTRIIDLPGEGLVQVVVKSNKSLSRCSSMADFFSGSASMGLGTPLCRAGLIVAREGEACYFALEMHHAIFDGYSNGLIMDAVEKAYHEGGKSEEEGPSFVHYQRFIKHAISTAGDSRSDTTAFWRDQLANSEAVVFPAVTNSSTSPEERALVDLHHPIAGLQWPTKAGITPSSAVRSALSLLLAAHTNSDDVKYGETVSGRNAPVIGIDRIAGPTIATIPVRVKLDWDQTVQQLQQQIQQQAVDVTPHAQYGLQNIRRISQHVAEASQFQLLLVIQPPREKTQGIFSRAKSVVSSGDEGGNLTLVAKDGDADSLAMYNSYAIMVIVQLEDNGLTLKINFDSVVIEGTAIRSMALQLEHLLRQLCSTDLARSKLRDITALSPHDVAQVWDWNRVLPEPVEDLVTRTIDNRASTDPESTAITAWDKELTYRQVKDLSTFLANRLRQDHGVGKGAIVVLSFQKSAWQLVTMLAALKLGAIVMPLSAPTSLQRAREVVQAVKPKLVITSSAASDLAPFEGLVPVCPVSSLIQDAVEYTDWVHVLEPIEVLPSDPALTLFTSGSTGTPKSILWTHETLSSNIRAHGISFGVTPTSRLFQFAGYEFDVSTVEALSALASGACCIVPSESDRTNRLAGAINDTRANWICLTPSVSETLAPESVPSLNTTVFAGEKLPQKTAFKWADSLDSVYNWYGPAEASVATSCRLDKKTWKPALIGKSTSGLTWLVDPKDPNQLAPIGAVAELCMEGPILGAYTGDSGAALNERSFFSPAWLQHGHGEVPGRHGRLYRTGDLVKYGGNGDIGFIGRLQESQRKLRGQRVELSEIESRVQSFLSGKFEVSVVAEIITPTNSNVEILALFINSLNLEEDSTVLVKSKLPVDDLETDLSRVLPSYMIPKVYISIHTLPISHTGKMDRRRLRQIGGSLTYEELASMQPSRQKARKPSTTTEKQLQELWAAVIGIEAIVINATDNFLRLGGDSIAAMRLVAAVRKRGLLLTVADVFEAPCLQDMAIRVKQDNGSPEHELEVPPFSLLGSGVNETKARAYAAKLCGIDEARIVDIYPVTPLQEGLLALGVKKPGLYVSRSVFELQPDIDTEQLERAWLSTVDKLTTLRSRIVDLPGQGFVQVVLDSHPLHSGTNVDVYVHVDEQNRMGPGTELCRAAIIDRHFILSAHHSIYDGQVLRMIMNELESQYLGAPGMTVTPFKNFIKHLSDKVPQEAVNFWKAQLSKGEPRQFPVLPSATYQTQAKDDLQHSISLDWPRTGMTPSTMIRAAWTILATQYTSSNDVIFALTVSGRQANMRGVENCVGPTISAVPIAVSVNRSETVEAFLKRMQQQMIDITPHEQYGLQNIQRLHKELAESRLLQTLLVVQPIAEGKNFNEDNLLFKARSFSSNMDTLGHDPFNSWALMVVCELSTSGLQLRVSFDGDIIDKMQIGRMVHQFETVLRQMCSESNTTATLDTVQIASSDDLDLFWSQNDEVPEDPDACVHDLVSLVSRTQPDAVAIDAWDGQLTYQQVDELSTALGRSLIALGVKKGNVVALNFEKTKWAPVVQLAIFKAGGIEVQLSTVVPDLRISKVFKMAGVALAVVSESRLEMVSQYAPSYTISQLLQLFQLNNTNTPFPTVTLHDPAAILVSSGSTGEPKQVLWSHRTLTANLLAHGSYLSITPSSRIFQFASYDFDVSTIESLSALIHAACICIPSESERLDGTTAAINRFRCTFVNITPSTAKAIVPNSVPTVETLVLSGENLSQDDVARWAGICPVLNWYGPAEHPATICAADVASWRTGVVSRIDLKQPALCWLVDPGNPNRLVPYGAVGEIVIEGPLCAEGYVGNEKMTGERFRRGAAFLNPSGTGTGTGTGRRRRRDGKTRLYYSGDLGRYDSMGNLVYMGRKDAQLKIRGQLVAPEEVQFHVRRNLIMDMACAGEKGEVTVVVDGIQLQSSTGLNLVAFVGPAAEEEVERATVGLREKLKRVLPSYAIPVYCIAVEEFPMNASGKIDRKRLREIGASFDPSRPTSVAGRRELTTVEEKTLQALWSCALGVDAPTISVGDSFLQLGDSVQAMRLVGIARQQGWLLSVAEVFEHPTLEEMAKIIRRNEGESEKDAAVLPFSLLDPNQDIKLACQRAAALCGVGEDDVEDIFPCTALQEGLLALTMKNEGSYTGRNVLKLASSIDVANFREAWDNVVVAIPILRTRIVDLYGQGLVQVVVHDHSQSWIEARDTEEYLTKESELPMGLGTPLMRCAIIVPQVNSQESAFFALTLHHSLYDGLTLPIIMETLEAFYDDLAPTRLVPFQSFVKYIGMRDKNAETEFWRTQFADLKAAPFPALPSSTCQPQSDSTLVHTVEGMAWRSDNITPSTVIRAASALLCSLHTSPTSSDIIFGAVSSGRKAPVSGIEALLGPTIATVPIRVKTNNDRKTVELLTSIQAQETQMIRYEQTGLSAIRQISEEAQQACQFQTLVVVQASQEESTKSGLFVSGDVERTEVEEEAHYRGFQSYALSLICTPEDGRLKVRFCFDSGVIERAKVQKMARDFEKLLKTLCSSINDETSLGAISLTSQEDLNRIWQWNSSLCPNVERPIHELILEIASHQPDAIAISAWDGEITYGELARITSNLALHLVNMGVCQNMIIPLCFEKSLYATVTFLSVLRAGGAGLLLDTALPVPYLQSVIQQVQLPFILSSPAEQTLAARLFNNTVVLGPNSPLLQPPSPPSSSPSPPTIPQGSPSTLAYTVFTSGTTGAPKGVLIPHSCISTAVTHQRSAIAMTSSERVYDFSAHTFDAHHWAVFHTLAAGATLCIPSERERREDLTGSMRRCGATMAFLTPSVARAVDVEGVGGRLGVVHLGGERVEGKDWGRWVGEGRGEGRKVKVFNAYGPAETTQGVMYGLVPSDPVLKEGEELSMGKGVAACTWIVDPESSERLVEVGEVGELYLEGPLVGDGYLNDPDKTAQSFVESPPGWLRRGSPDGRVEGRSKSRLYKTGDLVRYNPADGTLLFVGRKDTQVKLRGQRIELAKVENAVQQVLAGKLGREAPPVVAEVVVPSGTNSQVLVAFVENGSEDVQFANWVDGLQEALREQLPSYMVPAVFIPVETIPLATSGKTDRKQLREMGAALTVEQVDGEGNEADGELPGMENEIALQQLWSIILGVEVDKIRTGSSFLRLGGDSISAMRLTALARSRGYSLAVQSILQCLKLSGMAKAMERQHQDAVETCKRRIIEPFALLKNPAEKDSTLNYIESQCGIEPEQIEDVFPTTSVQKSLLSMTAKSDAAYVARYILRLRADIELDRFKAAWEQVSRTVAPILRQRILDVPTEGLVQVQVDESLSWEEEANDLDTYLQRDLAKPMGLATELTRLAIVPNANGELCCCITQHHAIYDGHSLHLLLTEVTKAYADITDPSPIAPFQSFIQHISNMNQDASHSFWRNQFANSEAIPFPELPEQDYHPKADSTVKRHLTNLRLTKRGDATANSLIRAAWAILTAKYTGTEDVVFGAMVTGRQAPLEGMERMVAPLISAVPMRVKFDGQKQTVRELLDGIRDQALAMVEFEGTELLEIRRVSEEAERGTRFNSLLVVQPALQDAGSKQDGPFTSGPEYISSRDGLDDFNPNAVMVMCQLTNSDEIKLEISFDSKVVDQAQMERIAAQFEHVLRQLSTSPADQKIEDIATVNKQDLQELWKWNATMPEAIEECVHDLINKTMKRIPDAPAICAWDGNLSYAELDKLSGRLAAHLVSLGAGPGAIIPLCFEKTVWYPVAALAILRAGTAAVAMDSTQPEGRLKSIVAQIAPKLVLASTSTRELASRLSNAEVVVVDEARSPEWPADPVPVNVSPSDTLYVVFTSGSTGTPKGIVTTHQNFSSAATHQTSILNIREGTRVFDFVSYSFDVSWSNHLQSLISGACLCIPSETERKNDIAGAFNRLNCDYTYFTPSVARSLDPSTMPGLRTLAMGGEAIMRKDVARWTQADTVIGIYGPAECAQALSFARFTPETRNNHVGIPYGANTWLVEPGRPDRLAAVGTIGELLIEGPTVSNGYFGDEAKTVAAYIRSPSWLQQGASPGHAGRQGVLYKAGDLLRYNSDGSLDFIGRKDGLIKLRGQRIELSEVEYHVRNSLRDPSLVEAIAAEIITPANSTSPILAMFFSLIKAEKDDVSTDDDADRNRARLARLIEGLEEKLWDQVPQYMVPGAYIYVDKVPMTTTNKTDRRTLRQLGSRYTLEELAAMQPQGAEARRCPSTETEKRLQALWSSVLEIEPDSISADSSFFRIGGESIAAMRMVSMARQEGLTLTVAEIFRAPKLCDLALVVAERNGNEEEIPTHNPFSLLKTDDLADFLKTKVVPFLDDGLTADHIQDVIPATDFQALSISENLQDPPRRYPHWIFNLPADVDFSRLERACTDLVNHFDILRSVFVPAAADDDGKFWQVILRQLTPAYDTIDAEDTNDLPQFLNAICAEDLTRPRKLGQSFIRFIAIKHTSSSSGSHKLIFRISHAYFDGFSWSQVLQALSSFYVNKPERAIPIPPSTPSFADYIAFRESRKQESLTYWSNRLQGWGYPSNLCRRGNTTWSINDRLSLRHTISLPSNDDDGRISPATRFHASFAFALSRFFGTHKLLFGRLLTGRSALPASLQNVVGPTMTELPVTVWVSRDLATMAKRLQEQFIEDSKYEAVGMREIIEGGTDWDYYGAEGRKVRDFGWRTAYQQEDETGTGNSNEEEGGGNGLFGKGGIGFYEREMPARERPEVYATPDKKSGVLILEFEGSRKWARVMGIGEEGVRRFLVVLGLVLGGDLGPHVR